MDIRLALLIFCIGQGIALIGLKKTEKCEQSRKPVFTVPMFCFPR